MRWPVQLGGKLAHWGFLNAVTSGRLVHVLDQISNSRFLVDTGASYSISLSLVSTFSAITDFWWTQQRTSSSNYWFILSFTSFAGGFPSYCRSKFAGCLFFSSACFSFTSAGIASGHRRLFTVAAVNVPAGSSAAALSAGGSLINQPRW